MAKGFSKFGEVSAKEAYSIWRGMTREGEPPAHWDDLSRQEKGLLIWVARYTLLNDANQ